MPSMRRRFGACRVVLDVVFDDGAGGRWDTLLLIPGIFLRKRAGNLQLQFYVLKWGFNLKRNRDDEARALVTQRAPTSISEIQFQRGL